MDFNLIHRIVKNIQETIFNTGKHIVSKLKDNVFSVKIKNLPKVQKVKGTVSLMGQKRIENQLKIMNKNILLIVKAIKDTK